MLPWLVSNGRRGGGHAPCLLCLWRFALCLSVFIWQWWSRFYLRAVQLQIRSKMNTDGGFRRKLWHAEEEEACLVTKVSLAAIGVTIGNDPDTCQRSECTNNNGGPVIKCTTPFCLFPWGHCHAIYRFSLVLSGFEWFCVGGMTLVFSGFKLFCVGFQWF